MSTAIDGLLFSWQKNIDYGPKLVADLDDAQMVLQPVLANGAPSNHPAWVFSHLNLYLPVVVAIIEGKEFEDPKGHPFGMLSTPQSDRNLYPTKQELVETFVVGHERIAQLLRDADDTVLERPINLPRWKQVMPKAGIALPYIMLNHENVHLGQLSAWRRIQGMPSV